MVASIQTGSFDPDISPAWSRIESKLVEQLIFARNKKIALAIVIAPEHSSADNALFKSF
jgi:hypothetical protein